MSLAGILFVAAWVGSGAGAPARAPADDAFAMQAPVVVQDTANGCLRCHTEQRRSAVEGVHSGRDIQCTECHGGNPLAVETEPAHRGRRFDPTSKVEVARLCSSCHSDPDQMRQFGLPAGEMAEFRTSRHGQVLLQGNADAPTCTDCHDAHTILRATDARSSVHPANIPETCARCHEDAGLMQKYDLPTDQLERYRGGAHGRAVLEDGNFAAPTCIGCHGAHSALPPRATEISTVCSRCHVLVGAEFRDSPHGAAALRGELPGCLGCHANHGTEVTAVDRIAAQCLECHEPDSPAALAGAEIQQALVSARTELRLAGEAIDELSRQGRRVGDARFKYRTAFTAFGELRRAEHGLDVEAVRDLGRQVSSVSREILETAEASDERRWEHRLMLIPVWFLALAAVALVVYRLGQPQPPEQRP